MKYLKKLISEVSRFKEKMTGLIPKSPEADRMWDKIQDAVIDYIEEKYEGKTWVQNLCKWARKKWDIEDYPDDIYDREE